MTKEKEKKNWKSARNYRKSEKEKKELTGKDTLAELLVWHLILMNDCRNGKIAASG